MNVAVLDISTRYRYVLRHKNRYWVERQTWDDDLEMWVASRRVSRFFWSRNDARDWMRNRGAF